MSWSLGVLVSWCLVSWWHGVLVSWSLGGMVFWCLDVLGVFVISCLVLKVSLDFGVDSWAMGVWSFGL